MQKILRNLFQWRCVLANHVTYVLNLRFYKIGFLFNDILGWCLVSYIKQYQDIIQDKILRLFQSQWVSQTNYPILIIHFILSYLLNHTHYIFNSEYNLAKMNIPRSTVIVEDWVLLTRNMTLESNSFSYLYIVVLISIFTIKESRKNQSFTRNSIPNYLDFTNRHNICTMISCPRIS